MLMPGATRMERGSEERVPRLALRISEAAAMLGIGRSKMYGLIRAGKVRSILVGDVMRIRVCDLSAYLEEMAQTK